MEIIMEQIGTNGQTSGDLASSLFSRIKRVVTNIAALMDLNGYRKEIARYESELPNKNQ